MSSDDHKEANYGSIRQPTHLPDNENQPDITDDITDDITLVTNDVTLSEHDLESVYQILGRGPAQYLQWTTVALAVCSSYIQITMVTVIVPVVKCDWKLPILVQSCLVLPLVLSLIATALCSGVSDYLGRKRVVIATELATLVGVALCVLAPNQWVLLSGLLITGTCSGVNMGAITCYATEFAEAKLRYVGNIVILAASLAGFLATYVFGFLIEMVGWRWFIVISSTPLLPSVILIAFLPESPLYYCMRKREGEAIESLRFIAKLNKTPLPQDLILVHHEDTVANYSDLFSDAECRKVSMWLSLLSLSDSFICYGLLIYLPVYFSSHHSSSIILESSIILHGGCHPLNFSDFWVLTLTYLLALVALTFAVLLSRRLNFIQTISVAQTAVLLLLLLSVNSTFSGRMLISTKILQSYINTSASFMISEKFPRNVWTKAGRFVNGWAMLGGAVGVVFVEISLHNDTSVVVGVLVAASLTGTVSCFVLRGGFKHCIGVCLSCIGL